MAALDINALVLTADQTIGLVCGWNSRERAPCCHIQLHDHAGMLLERARASNLQCTLLILSPDAPDRLDWDTARFLGVRVFNAPSGSLSDLLASEVGFAREPARTLFVSSDRTLRAQALKAGMRAAPHPRQAAQILAGARLRFCELIGDGALLRRLEELTPYDLEDLRDGRLRVIGTLPEADFESVAAAGLVVMGLDADPEHHDLLWMGANQPELITLGSRGGSRLLQADAGRHLFALSGKADEVSWIARLGRDRCRMLLPNPDLFGTTGAAGLESATLNETHGQLLEAAASHELPTTSAHLSRAALTELELRSPRWPVSDSEFQTIIDRYGGARPLDGAGVLRSREIRHPDNARTVSALRDELAAMGYCVWTQAFAFDGKTLHNVIAEMPGRGILPLKSEIMERLRRILMEHPQPEPLDDWLGPLADILGWGWRTRIEAEGLSPRQLRTRVLREFGLLDYPFKFCSAAGVGAGVVLLGTKLDSMAALSRVEGPSADDNAAGIAATLAIARYLRRFNGELTHSVRVCFFNAEEEGLVGSQLYAANLKAGGAMVRGVFCLDMVGTSADSNETMLPVICDPSDLVMERFDSAPGEQVRETVFGRGSVPWPCGGGDRGLVDSAPLESDHSPFRKQGYPAIAVSEGSFALPMSNLPRWPGQSFHRPSDNWIDVSYANDIARAVAQAAKELAV